MLAQEVEGKLRSVRFASRAFSDTESRWHTMQMTFWCKMGTRTIQTIRTRKTNEGSYRLRKFKVANFRKTTALRANPLAGALASASSIFS